MTFTEVGRMAHTEAICTVPGLLAAGERGEPADASTLLHAYFEDITALGLSACEGWAALFNASMHWNKQLSRTLANRDEVDVSQVLQKMGSMAAHWIPDAH